MAGLGVDTLRVPLRLGSLLRGFFSDVREDGGLLERLCECLGCI